MIGPEDLPSVNAILNGLSGLLLIFGYIAIRNRHVRLHVLCMVSALSVSALFLASYLYYHVVVRHGQPTLFTGQGGARFLYFGILISHTILAMAVAPMAVFTASLGLRGRLQQHVRLARWTWPLWLYVSVTGVLVYWMLYHLFPSHAVGLE